ncbi:MAG: hypothetical protein V1897_15570 [Pseudomonadota bacterium]
MSDRGPKEYVCKDQHVPYARANYDFCPNCGKDLKELKDKLFKDKVVTPGMPHK